MSSVSINQISWFNCVYAYLVMCAEVFVLLYHLNFFVFSNQDSCDPESGQVGVQLGCKDVYTPCRKSLMEMRRFIFIVHQLLNCDLICNALKSVLRNVYSYCKWEHSNRPCALGSTVATQLERVLAGRNGHDGGVDKPELHDARVKPSQRRSVP